MTSSTQQEQLSGLMMIVVAWTKVERRFVGTYGARPGSATRPEDWQDVVIPVACTWLLEGTRDDLAAAEAEVSTYENGLVLVYPTHESDPLGLAKQEVLRQVDRLS